MASSMDGLTRLSEIPLELQLQVVKHLNFDDLKQWRLVSKDWQTRAAECLFKVLHVAPNTKSFDHATSVAEHHVLSRMVDALIFHSAMLGRAQSLSSPETLREIVLIARALKHGASVGVDELSDALSDVDEDRIREFYEAYKLEIHSQTDFVTKVAPGSVGVLIQKLPNIQGLKICACMQRKIDGIFSSHSSRRVTLPAEIDVYCNRSFLVLPDLFPRRSKEEQPYPEHLDGKISSLRHFDVHIPPMWEVMQLGFLRRQHISLTSFLGRTQSLSSLTLNFAPLWRDGGEVKTAIEISHHLFTNVKLSQLHTLSLTGTIARESLLAQFICAHKKTIRTLYLADITMDWIDHGWYSWFSSSPQRPELDSFYRLFKEIHDHCELANATLSGRFHNGNGEEWLAYPKFRRPCIRAEIEDYLSHRLDKLQSSAEGNGSLASEQLPPSIAALKEISAVEKHKRKRFSGLDDFSFQTCSTIVSSC
jgi:hypothetical protein